MTRKIRQTISTCSILAAAISILLASITFYRIAVNREIEQLAYTAHVLKEYMKSDRYDLSSMPQETYRITHIRSDGEVLYDSHMQNTENQFETEEFQEALMEGKGHAERYSSTFMQNQIYYALAQEDHSVIRVSCSAPSAGALLLEGITPLLWICVLMLVFSYFASWKLSEKLAYSLNTMDLQHPLTNQKMKEIDPLLSRINRSNQIHQDHIEVLEKRLKKYRKQAKS